ncbi:sigma-70 family RNA polymerase sigma factor [Actinocorallia populi]|uniref:sigma-70 family RNA polymerase sigma factor n=1 Tax=Actinocorallia populi TaxID=2079200 RepID=UPI000D088254|nr:sigma-70 family RNA polymerase sigma factor [Actinocorallia populi]
MGEHAGADQGDAVLITRAREGDDEACGVLRERHGRAALRLAGLLTRDQAEAEAAVDLAFAGVFEILRQGGGPSDAFRPFLLTTLRRRLAGHPDEEREAFDPDAPFVDPALEGLEHRPMVRAYLSLPERWRAVLWHTAVEGASPARVLPLFGIGADGVTALAHRAREGLRQAYLRLHPAEEQPEECRPLLGRIRVYLRGDLPDRENARMRRHLGECARCRTAVADLREVDGRLPDVAALVLGTAASGYLVPGGFGRPFRWAGAVLAAWWWRSSPNRRKQALAAGVLVAALTAGLLAWPLSGTEPAQRPDVPDEARVAAGPEQPSLSPSRRAQTDRTDRADRGAGPGGGPKARPPASLPTSPVPPRPVEPWAAPVLEADIGTAGVLQPGRTGVVVLTVWNAGNAPSGEVVADVSLPRGVRSDGPAGAGWSCLPAERALRCVHVPLPPGGGSSALLPVAVASDARAGASPEVRLAGSRVSARASTGVSTSGLPARFVTEGRARVTTAGNVLLSCPHREAACGLARQRRGVRLDNDQWEMGPLDLDGAADTRTSSPAVLEVPGRVRWAGLYWSGTTGRDAARAREYTARLRGPSGGYRTVEASWVDRVGLPGQRAYQAFAEVTEQVRRGGRGRWWVADVPALEGPGRYAGWSLVVVADDPAAAPARTVVLDGARPLGVADATRLRVPLGGLPRGGPAARIGLLAWEGDAARAGDRVLLDGRPLSSPNAFTGTLPHSGRALAFGMDAVAYEAELGDPSVLEVVSTADATVVGVVTITAPSHR